MKVGDWVRFNYSGLVGMVTHVDEHDCTVQLNGGYRKVLSRGEVQVIEPTEPARTEAHMDKQERERLRALALAATPGPWHRNIPPIDHYPTIFAGRNTHVLRIVPRSAADARAEANADYVVGSAPDAVLRLLDALDAAEQRAERLAAAIRNFRSAPQGDDAARFAALYAAGEQTGEGGGAP